MRAVEIVDADDPRVAAFRLNERGLNPRLRRRTDTTPVGLFVAEGDLVVERAVTAGCRPVALLCAPAIVDAAAALVPASTEVFTAADAIRSAITGLGVALDVVGLFERPPLVDAAVAVRTARRIVVIDRVDNPTNVGAIVRSCTALGADALLVDRTSADPLTRRALRVSMGAAFSLPTARYDDARDALALLHEAGVTTIALTLADDSRDISDVAAALAPDEPRAILLGAERSGLDPHTQAACTHRAHIPMHRGIDSLNVAAASAVAAHCLFT